MGATNTITVRRERKQIVADLDTGRKLEVPDWTLYGEKLERLGEPERRSLKSRGVDVAR